MDKKRRREAKKRIKQAEKKAGKKSSYLPALYIFAVALGIIGIGTSLLFSLSPEFTENVYTKSIYPVVRTVAGFLPSLTKLSFTEISIWLLVVSVLVLFIIASVRLLTGRVKIRRVGLFFADILLIAAILLNWFNLVGGLNYRTITLDKKLGLEVREHSINELYGFCVYLRGQANKTRRSVSENSEGIYNVKDLDKYLELTANEVAKIDEINVARTKVPAAKQFRFPALLTKFGIAGICMPFYAEANVNTEQPSLLVLSDAAHENAHYLGVAREDEANYVAYIACANSDNPDIRYSGIVLALIYCSSRLYDCDSDLYSELVNGYDKKVAADIEDYYAFWEKTEGTMSDKISEAVNDAYLKSNGIKSGEQSYGETVDLMLADYEARSRR